MSIGARFRQLRHHLKLSQDEIGAACGDATKSLVSQWESDKTAITMDRLAQLRQHHRFSIDWVITGEGAMISEGMYVADPRIAAIAATLLHAMEDGREYLVEKTQKEIDGDLELIARASAQAKANDR